MLAKTNLTEAKPISSPMVTGCKLTKSGSDPLTDPYTYRSVVDALQYVTITRPEISFPVNKVCQFMKEPLEDHWVAFKRILRHPKGTLTWGLHLKPASASFSINAFCDADWASDPDDRRSTSGGCVYFGPNILVVKETVSCCPLEHRGRI